MLLTCQRRRAPLKAFQLVKGILGLVPAPPDGPRNASVATSPGVGSRPDRIGTPAAAPPDMPLNLSKGPGSARPAARVLAPLRAAPRRLTTRQFQVGDLESLLSGSIATSFQV
jgi:hypothetical protein